MWRIGSQRTRWTLGMLVLVLLGGCAGPSLPLSHEGLEDGYVKVVDHAAGRYRLVVFSPGIPAELIDVHRVKGWLSLYFYDTRFREPLDGWATGEAQEPISVDYSELERGVLRVTSWTWDPRDSVKYEPGTTPLYVSTLRALPNGTCEWHSRLLLKPEPLDEKRIRDLMEAAKSVAAVGWREETDLRKPLAHLRNMSPANPALVLGAFDDLLRTGKFDGACLELLLAYRGEVMHVEDLVTPNHPARSWGLPECESDGR